LTGVLLICPGRRYLLAEMSIETRQFRAVHLDLDEAWPADVLRLERIDARSWGPRLRYIARRPDVEEFWGEIRERLPEVVVYGSGDFHHLAGVLMRRVSERPVTLVSFDNHPDWDVRPPYWSCGGWAARTLRSGLAQRVSVWGCGNFELRAPARWFADWAALRSGKLEVHAWSERQPPGVCRKFNCMSYGEWRLRFEEFARGLSGGPVYVTVDMDCLREQEAMTNWEQGLFAAGDVRWAIEKLRASCELVGLDICGAYSEPAYSRLAQRFAGWWDHPKVAHKQEEARRLNVLALREILSSVLPSIRPASQTTSFE